MTDKNGMILFIILIVVLLVYIWIRQDHEKENFGSSYARLGGGYNTQLFSPCKTKRCAGGPYMFTSDPYMQALCQGVTNADLAQNACGKAFHGRPVHFDFTSLSNAAWDNALCSASSPSSICTL